MQHTLPSPAGRFDWFIRPVDRLTDFGNLLSGLCLLGIFVMIGAEILSRNLLGVSLSFSWDLSAYLMGGCFMLAAASALKSGSHVRVTGVAEMLPARGAWLLELAACIVGFVIALMLTWSLCQMTWLSYVRGSTSASVVRIPLVWPQGVLALGCVLLCLQLVAQTLRVLRGEQLSSGAGLE